MEHGRGLAAATDWTWSRINRGRGQVEDLDTGKYADRSRTWTVCGHGQTAVVVTDWMRARPDYRRGCGLDMVNSRLRTGRGQVRGNFLTAAGTQAWPSCGISRTLPGNCPEVARTWRRDCLEINRTRPGCCAECCPDVSPAIARTLRRKPRRMVRGRCAGIARQFAGYSANTDALRI